MKPVDSDHYAVLELKPGSSMEQIKSQYRNLAKRYHPDLNNNDAQCQEKLLRVNAAYAFLSDATRKAAYDARLRAKPSPSVSATKPPPPAASRAAEARPQPSVTRPRHPAPVNATKYDLRNLADIKMTQTSWLGATAVLVLFLLGIGLSLDSADQSGFGAVESASPVNSGDGAAAEPGDADGTFTPSQPPIFQIPSGDASQTASHRSAPAVSHTHAPSDPHSSPHIGHTANAAVLPASGSPAPDRPARQNIAGALAPPLLARYQAVVPGIDHLIRRGHTVYAANTNYARTGRRDESRHALLDQLASDLAGLSAARRRIKPAIAALFQQSDPEELQKETEAILGDIRTLEEERQPVRDDLQALSAASLPPPARTDTAPVAAISPAPPKPVAPVPPAPKVSTASAVAPEPEKPPEKPADTPVSRSETPPSSSPSFITWGKP